ncbi:amidohydrolase family protein [Metaclostridioides mangenotii]|uniref:Cytosine/adenosine deaminase-related metal-dependent hydrolase n=1 Tax=Metaclostridioides mangenotii TaxID=1540 RepID=A0ABS4E8I3_9FIRM|nr:cytosine/adenosine deaminase-related metal-dependent hydrolase [Clostridioides mangenotii]
MVNILKGNIVFTETPKEFKVFENNYIVIEDGKTKGIFDELPSEYSNINVIDYTDKIIIPGMNDLHCHAPQFRNLGMAMDKELLPWLNSYTFPEESKYESIDYAKNMYPKFVKEMWRAGTTRASVFATVHKDSTRELMNLFEKAGLGAYVGKVNMNMNCPDPLLEDTFKSLGDTEEILKEYSKKDSIVKPIITPRFVPSCTSDLLKRSWRFMYKIQCP